MVYKDLCKGGLDKGKAGAVKGFIDYGLGAGQSVLGQLQYAKLPAPLLAKAQGRVEQPHLQRLARQAAEWKQVPYPLAAAARFSGGRRFRGFLTGCCAGGSRPSPRRSSP